MSRATYACARCFRQKRRCDGQAPACSRCRQAGVECVGVDRATAAPIPRSLIQYLETAIADLEAELRVGTSPGAETEGRGSPGCAPSPQFRRQVHDYVGRLAGQPSSTACCGQDDLASLSLKKLTALSLTAPSALPLRNPGAQFAPGGREMAAEPEADAHLGSFLSSTSTAAGTSPHNQFGGAASNNPPPPPVDLAAIPRHVSDVLVRVYVDRILPQYPFLDRAQVQAHYVAAYAAHPGPPVSRFVVTMILAISTMTSKSDQIDKVMAFGDALFRSAMELYESLPTDSLETIQCTMLVCQFANLRPGTANIWAAKETVMRMAIGLGLHQSACPSWDGLDDEAQRTRARVFWVLYSMDRSISVPALKPVSIMDDQISILSPEELHEESGRSTPTVEVHGVFEDSETQVLRRKRQQWLNHVRLRRLESDIYSVNFGEADTMAKSAHAAWLADMDRQLLAWHESVAGQMINVVDAGPDAGPDWFDFIVATVRIYLHMPCPRNPTPDHASRLVYFEASRTLIRGFLGMMQTGMLKFDWQCTQQCHCAAMLILDNAAPLIQAYSQTQVMHLLEQFSAAYTMMSRRWPACVAIANYFEYRRSLLSRTSLTPATLDMSVPRFGGSSVLNTPAARDGILGSSHAIHDPLQYTPPGDQHENVLFDDNYWGHMGDNFEAFMNVDWDAFGTGDNLMGWSI